MKNRPKRNNLEKEQARDPAWQQLATHEAAHVVGYYAFGRIIFHVALTSDNGGWVRPVLGDENIVYKIRQNMVVAACGSMAEKIICGDDNAEPTGKDLADLQAAAIRIHGMMAPKEVIDDEVQTAVAKAIVLIQRYREAIEKIADSLLSVVDEIESVTPDIFGKESPLS